jgi:hypothetical protein
MFYLYKESFCSFNFSAKYRRLFFFQKFSVLKTDKYAKARAVPPQGLENIFVMLKI